MSDTPTATEVQEALAKLNYCVTVVLCEYGSGGVPMIVRLAHASDEATVLIRRLEEGGARDEARREHDCAQTARGEAERGAEYLARKAASE